MRTLFNFICTTLLVAPSVVLAAAVPAGVQSTLWFSRDPLPIGETVQVYSSLYNSGEYDLSGVITLLHGTSPLDSKPFLVAGKGGSTVISFPYYVATGTHAFSVSLSKMVLMSPDSSMKTIDPTIARSQSAVEKRVAVASAVSASPAASTSPIQVGTQAIRSATEIATSSVAKAIEKAEEVKTQVEESTPARVIAVSAPVIGRVEDFRVESATDAHRRIIAVAQSLSTSTSTQVSSTWGHLASGVTEGKVFKTPFRYLELFLLLIWNFLVAHPFVFYGLIIAFCYKVVRAVLGMLF